MYRRGTLTPRSEPATPGGAESEPELESGQSPSGDTPCTEDTSKIVYLIEDLPLVTDMYESMSGPLLIRKAFTKGGGMSLWGSGLSEAVKAVILDSMPTLLARRCR